MYRSLLKMSVTSRALNKVRYQAGGLGLMSWLWLHTGTIWFLLSRIL
jgi:hypothetical protein